MIGCTDDLENDINDLKDKVENLENGEIAGMEFQGSDLVITFGDGTTTSVTVPDDVLPGNVSDFDINNETGIITVTFADGTTREYIVLDNGNTTYLSGTLSGDYGITSMTLGDVELVKMAYDDQDRMINAQVNLPDGNGNVINVMELQNNYADAQPVMIAIEKSLYNDINYTTDSYFSSTYVYLPDDNGYSFVEEEAGTELYILYNYRYFTGTEYRYNKYEHCWFVPDDQVNHDTYEKYYPVAGEDSLFYKTYNNYQYVTIDDVSGRLYYPDRIVRIEEVYEAGEVMDTSTARLTMRDDDLIEKIEMLDWESEVSEYFEITYDANDLITQVDMYDIFDITKAADTDTIKFGRAVMTYTDNLLTLVQFEILDEDGNVDETMDITKLVYDDAGNPVEVWAIPDYEAGDGYTYTVDGSGKIIITPIDKELQKVVEIEYNYTLPNFFGKTLEYMIPELKGIKVINAPVRLVHSGFFDFVNMEYFDFNQGGYPAKVKMEAYISSSMGGLRKAPSPIYFGGGVISVPVGTEMFIDYALFD